MALSDEDAKKQRAGGYADRRIRAVEDYMKFTKRADELSDRICEQRPRSILPGGCAPGTPSTSGLPEGLYELYDLQPAFCEVDLRSGVKDLSIRQEEVPVIDKKDSAKFPAWGIQVMRILNERGIWPLVLENKYWPPATEFLQRLVPSVERPLNSFPRLVAGPGADVIDGLRAQWRFAMSSFDENHALALAEDRWTHVVFQGDVNKYVSDLHKTAQELAFLGHEVPYESFVARLKLPLGFFEPDVYFRTRLCDLPVYLRAHSCIQNLVDDLLANSHVGDEWITCAKLKM